MTKDLAEQRLLMPTPITTLTVYFEGASNELDNFVTQIGLFSALTHATDLLLDAPTSTQRHYKISYDGCGVTHGMTGLLFAVGLMDQCRDVYHYIEALQSVGHSRLVVNAVGLSRGGVAVIFLAQLLGHLDPESVALNLLLFDPVPGNLISTARYLDHYSYFSIANTSLSLASCRNINHVLALYPYQALPDLAFHAPLFPCYPSECQVEEDVVLGCHQGALFCRRHTPSSILSYERIKEWLLEQGTELQYSGDAGAIAKGLAMSQEDCIRLMQAELEELQKTPKLMRYAHSSPGGAYIEKKQSADVKYLNKWHRALCCDGDSRADSSDLLLVIHRVEPWSLLCSVGSTKL